MMKNKVILGSALALLATLTVAFAGSGSAPFTIDIVVDTTIFIPTLCETGASTSDDALDFRPGITGLDDAEAVAIDSCASGIVGDWNVTMAGNVQLDISFQLNDTLPTGVEVALWGNDAGAANGSPYTSNANYFNLTTVPSTPTWAQSITDSDILVIWQRIAANTSAVGTTTAGLSIVLTSSAS